MTLNEMQINLHRKDFIDNDDTTLLFNFTRHFNIKITFNFNLIH